MDCVSSGTEDADEQGSLTIALAESYAVAITFVQFGNL